MVQVLWRTLERVEEGARHRGENHLPTQQAKQAVEQRVLHVMHLAALLFKVQLHRLFHAQGRVFYGQLQLNQAAQAFFPPGLRWPSQLALQTRQHSRQGLHLNRAGGLLGNLCGQCMGLGPLFTALEHPNATDPRVRVVAKRVDLQGQVPVSQALTVLTKLVQQARAATQQPRVIAVQGLNLSQHL
ncbi:hypothetical protein D3C72_1186480 [compost metagenome]